MTLIPYVPMSFWPLNVTFDINATRRNGLIIIYKKFSLLNMWKNHSIFLVLKRGDLWPVVSACFKNSEKRSERAVEISISNPP